MLYVMLGFRKRGSIGVEREGGMERRGKRRRIGGSMVVEVRGGES